MTYFSLKPLFCQHRYDKICQNATKCTRRQPGSFLLNSTQNERQRPRQWCTGTPKKVEVSHAISGKGVKPTIYHPFHQKLIKASNSVPKKKKNQKKKQNKQKKPEARL